MSHKKYNENEVELMRRMLLEYLNAKEVLEMEKKNKPKRTLTREEVYKASLNLPWYTDIVEGIILSFFGILIIIIICLIYCH